MNEKQKLETSNTAGLRNDAHYNANELYLSVKHISISSLCCTLNHKVDYDKQRAFWVF